LLKVEFAQSEVCDAGTYQFTTTGFVAGHTISGLSVQLEVTSDLLFAESLKAFWKRGLQSHG